MISGIYFVEAIGCERIKIGYSRNVEGRLLEMQVDCPFDLELLVVTAGAKDIEPAVHDKFRGARVRGEWFEATAELRAFVGELRQGVEVISLLSNENLRAKALAGAQRKIRAHWLGLGNEVLRGEITVYSQRVRREE